MFGLLILIAIYAVLGFMLAWIAGVVAKEEISIGAGVLVLVLTAILAILVGMGISAATSPEVARYAAPVVNFGALTLLLNLVIKLSWKHSAIIAAIYTAILFVVGIGLATFAA